MDIIGCTLSPKSWYSFFHLFHHQLGKDSCWHLVSKSLCSLMFLQINERVLYSYILNKDFSSKPTEILHLEAFKQLNNSVPKFIFPPFFMVVKKHNVCNKKFTILIIFMYTFNSVEHIHIIVNRSSELSLCKYETLYPLNNPSSPFPMAPGNHHSPFCLFEFDYFRYHM